MMEGEVEMEAARQGFSLGRGYPDSGYDTLRVDLTGDKSQMCVDIDLENSLRKRKEVNYNENDNSFKPRHSSQFSDFQLLNKGGETVLLSIEGHGENLERAVRSSSRQREEDKIMWQVGREAPPRNVVKD